MAAQGTLDIEPPHEPQFDNFVAGANEEVLSTLRQIVTAPRAEGAGFWIWGAPSTGKSHLLRAAVQAAGAGAAYVGFTEAAAPELLERRLDLLDERIEFVALDDVGHGGERVAERVFRLYERVLANGGVFIAAHAEAATHLSLGLDDLDSRLRSLMHFQLKPLDDEHKARVLVSRAAHRGYELDDSVVAYWLARGPRDLDALLTDLDRLSRASLRRQSRVTIPLLKDELGY